MSRKEQIQEAAIKYVEEGFPDIFIAGFLYGAMWADQHPNWISVEDELPPHDTEYEGRSSVDCYITDGVDVEISYYNYYNNTWDDVRLSGEVTHWYIPQPPRKEE